jgi:hypothetical protein
MYSPKIKEDLIPKIYQEARARRVPMTVLVNTILEHALTEQGRVTQKINLRKEGKNHDENTGIN